MYSNEDLEIINQSSVMNQHMLPVTTKDVEARMLQLRGKLVLIDRDVATLYGVETKRVIEAVRNNPDKFPPGY